MDNRLKQISAICIQISFNTGGMLVAGLFKIYPHWRFIMIYGLLIPLVINFLLMYFLY